MFNIFTNKTTELFLVGLFLIFPIIFTGCGTVTPSTSSSTSGIKHIKISPSWSNWYTNTTSLKQDADLGVLGIISQVYPSTNNGYVETKFLLNVEEVLSDPQNSLQGSKTLPVAEIGGTINDTRYEPDDLPLFEKNQRLVLFLTVKNNVGFIIGGPSGTFYVKEDKIIPATSNGIKLDNGTTTQSFNQLVKALPQLPKVVTPVSHQDVTSKFNLDQSVNLTQTYDLSKASSILIKASLGKDKTITDAERIKSISSWFNKNLTLVEKPQDTQLNAKNTSDTTYIVFIFNSSKSIGFEYVRNNDVLNGYSPDKFTVKVSADLDRLLASV